MNRRIDDKPEDTEGHTAELGADDIDLEAQEDAEGHAGRIRIIDGKPSKDDDGKEGHVAYARNVGVGFDPEPEPEDAPSLTAADAKDTASDDDDDGSEGHLAYARNVGVSFDLS